MADKDLLVRLGGDAEALRKDMEDAARMMFESGRKLQRIGDGITKKVTRSVGLGILSVAKFSQDAEGNFKKIQDQIDKVSDHSGILKPVLNVALTGVKSLSKEYSELGNKTKDAISGVALAVTAIGPALQAIGAVQQGLAGLSSFIVSEVPMMVKKLSALATPFKLTVATAAIAGLIGVYKLLDQRYQKSVRLRNELRDAQLKADRAAAGEVASIKTLQSVINDKNVSMRERKEAYKQLQKVIPNVAGAVLTEGKHMKKLNEQVERYIVLTEKRALAEVIGSKLADLEFENLKRKRRQIELLQNGKITKTSIGKDRTTVRDSKEGKEFKQITKEMFENEKVAKGFRDELKKITSEIFNLKTLSGELTFGGKAKDDLDKLLEKISQLERKTKVLVLKGDVEGAKTAAAQLDVLEKKMVLIQNTIIGFDIDVKKVSSGVTSYFTKAAEEVGKLDNVITKISQKAAASAKKMAFGIVSLAKRLEAAASASTLTDKIDKEVRQQVNLYEQLGEPIDEVALKKEKLLKAILTLTALGFSVESNLVQKLINQYKKLGNTLKEELEKITVTLQDSFASAVGDFGANLAVDGFTAIFQGQSQALKELNGELEKNRKLASDPTASKEQRKAAFARMASLKEEIKAEKQRGNVLLQSTKLLLDSAKQAIKAALAEAIAAAILNAIKTPGIGIFLAGGAALAAGALFSKFVPKLAKGGVAKGETLAVVGDNVGAGRGNPEIIAPLNIVDKKFRESLRQMFGGFKMPGISMPSLSGIGLSLKIGGEFRIQNQDLYAVVENAIYNIQQRRGFAL